LCIWIPKGRCKKARVAVISGYRGHSNKNIDTDDDSNIKLSINGATSKEISADNRVVSAEEIYQLVDFHIGDKYVTARGYINEKDEKVVESLEMLLNGIFVQLNAISNAKCADII